MIWPSTKIIDPALPLGKDERQEIVRVASTRCVQHRSNRVVLIAILFCTIAVFFVALASVDSLLGARSDWREFVAMVISFVVFNGLLFLVFSRRLSRLAFIEIRRRGLDVCWRCGYWLRELDDDIARCPECGAERRPMPETKS